MPIIQAEKLCKTYFHALGDVQVLVNASFTINEGESCAVIGESGRGKTTLLYVLAGLDSFEGTVRIKGQDIGAMDERGLSAFRAENIGFVFQHHFLMDDLSAFDNALLPLRITRSLTPKNIERLRGLFERLGIAARMGHRPTELSGGERQRVSLVRALANRPPLLFADEPTGGLDRENAENLENLLFELVREEKTTLLVSTHSPRLAGRCARILPIDTINNH